MGAVGYSTCTGRVYIKYSTVALNDSWGIFKNSPDVHKNSQEIWKTVNLIERLLVVLQELLGKKAMFMYLKSWLLHTVNYAIFFQGDDRIYDGLFRLYQYGDHRCQMFVMQFAPTLISNYFATFGRRVVLSVSHQCWKYNTFNLFNETSDSQNFHLLSHFQFQALYKVAYIYYSWFILLGSWKIGNSFVVHLQ